jgi:hypothetical protein
MMMVPRQLMAVSLPSSHDSFLQETMRPKMVPVAAAAAPDVSLLFPMSST